MAKPAPREIGERKLRKARRVGFSLPGERLKEGWDKQAFKEGVKAYSERAEVYEMAICNIATEA